MGVRRTVKCDVKGCENEATEPDFGRGFEGWAQVMGVKLNGSSHPFICPRCKVHVMNFVDSLDASDLPAIDFGEGTDGVD